MKQPITTAIIIAAAMCAPAAASAQTDNATFGVHTGYTSKNSSAIAGIFFQYRLNPELRIAPEVGCVFRHQNLDALTVDVNMHYVFDFDSDKIGVYPIAGIDYSGWSVHHTLLDPGKDKDVTTRQSKFGVNLGAGFEVFATSTLKLKAEWKYTLTSKYSTCVVSVGAGYMF